MKRPLWLTMAEIELGTREVIGPGDNPTIAKYWEDAGMSDKAMGQDEVAWCGAFANAMLVRAGAYGTGSPLARSFTKYGIKLRAPVLGCLSVYRSPLSDWQGHVHFYLGHDAAGNMVGLGGNQSDSVNIAPFKATRHLGYFWPKGFHVEPEWIGRIEWKGQPMAEGNDR